MSRVDDCQTKIEGLNRSMVRNVAGDQCIGNRRSLLHEIRAGSGDNCDSFQNSFPIPRDPEPGDAPGVSGNRIQHSKCSLKRPETADRRNPLSVIVAKRPDVGQVEDGSQGICGASWCGVEVCVGDQERSSDVDQAEGTCGRGPPCDHPVDRGEQQRVIGDQKIHRVCFNRRNDILSDLVADAHPVDPARSIPELEANRIPGSGCLGPCPLRQMVVDLFDCRHKGQSNSTETRYPPGMEITAANSWSPPEGWASITVVDSHAGGEPFRVVTNGLPEIPGSTVLDRRRYASQHLDHLRQALMWEPRGHRDMYGGWIGAPVAPDSDFSILFTHNEGYSTMCGHGIIAATKVVLDTGMMPISPPETTLKIDTPAGQITSVAAIVDGAVALVRFRNVASFVDGLNEVVEVDGIGAVTYDLAFGGAYYAYVDAPSMGIPWPPTDSLALIDYGRRIKRAIAEQRDIHHPEHEDLGFLYGVIFSGPPVDPHNHVRNVCVFADGEIDRSPTGTGVSGHIALETARGRMAQGDRIVVESIVGSEFSGTLVEIARVGNRKAVVPEVSGTAHITGRSEFWFDPEDGLSPGFLLP